MLTTRLQTHFGNRLNKTSCKDVFDSIYVLRYMMLVID